MKYILELTRKELVAMLNAVKDDILYYEEYWKTAVGAKATKRLRKIEKKIIRALDENQ